MHAIVFSPNKCQNATQLVTLPEPEKRNMDKNATCTRNQHENFQKLRPNNHGPGYPITSRLSSISLPYLKFCLANALQAQDKVINLLKQQPKKPNLKVLIPQRFIRPIRTLLCQSRRLLFPSLFTRKVSYRFQPLVSFQ
jgi:hypothetical protein